MTQPQWHSHVLVPQRRSALRGRPEFIGGPGDVIVDVDTHAVGSPADAAREIQSAMNRHNHALALPALRDGEPVFVGIQLVRTRVDGSRPRGRRSAECASARS